MYSNWSVGGVQTGRLGLLMKNISPPCGLGGSLLNSGADPQKASELLLTHRRHYNASVSPFAIMAHNDSGGDSSQTPSQFSGLSTIDATPVLRDGISQRHE